MRTITTCLAFLTAASASAFAQPAPTTEPTVKSELQLTSSAFSDNSAIPEEYSCEGQNISPPLSWSNAPAGTKSFALVAEDPDAPKGTVTHWLVLDIPASTTSLRAGGALPQGAMAMKNTKGQAGYMGPCPPSGTHHYVFTVLALDLPTVRAANPNELYNAVQGHVLARGKLTGTYQKHK